MCLIRTFISYNPKKKPLLPKLYSKQKVRNLEERQSRIVRGKKET